MLLPWHESASTRVEDMLEQGRLPHALLIRGPQGWGEVVFANWLALRLLQLQPPVAQPVEDGQAAAGPPAVDIPARTMAHPDLRWVQADGAVIKVDAIRMLAEFAIGTRQSAACKVAVIESAQLMNENSANALLKTLEEPPPDTHIILTSSQAGRLLPTVMSRCQSVVLEADETQAKAWLRERWDAEEVSERFIEYGYAPLECDEAMRDQEPALLPALQRLSQTSTPAAEMAELLNLNVDRLLGRWYRCCIALAAGQIAQSLLAPVPPQQLARFTDELVRTRRQILYSNSANVRLLLERLAVSWRRMFAAVTQA